MIKRVKLNRAEEQKRSPPPRSKPNRMTFTDLAIKRLKPPKVGQRLYWDKAQKGLSLLVSSGGTKLFRSQYKLNGGWQTRKLGRFGEVVTDETENANVTWARDMTRRDRALALDGIDPKKQGQTTLPDSYGEVVDQFIEHHAKPRQRTWEQTRAILRRNCAPWLNKPFAEITTKDARALLRSFVADGHGPKAKLTQSWIKTLWRWAYEEELIDAPIMDRLKINIEPRERDRVYSDDEVRAIWNAAVQLTPVERGYVKLLVLLAPRKTALANMRASQLDDASNPTLWTTPHEFTKSKKTAKKRKYETPLPPLAQRIVKGLAKEIGDDDEDDLLFPSSRKSGVPLSPSGPLVKKLVKHGAPTDFNFHAARHTLATWLQEEGGHSEAEAALILNHASSTVTAGYLHSAAIKRKRELLEEWEQHVSGLVQPEGAALLR